MYKHYSKTIDSYSFGYKRTHEKITGVKMGGEGSRIPLVKIRIKSPTYQLDRNSARNMSVCKNSHGTRQIRPIGLAIRLFRAADGSLHEFHIVALHEISNISAPNVLE